MPPPLAYFLTWTTHGSWLHGDERGSVDRDHAIPGTPCLATDGAHQRQETARLRARAMELDARGRVVVTRTIADHCALRGWDLLAVNVRSNHVHVVVACPPEVPPERAMSEFKAWSTRRLRAARLVAPDKPVWTHHGSTR